LAAEFMSAALASMADEAFAEISATVDLPRNSRRVIFFLIDLTYGMDLGGLDTTGKIFALAVMNREHRGVCSITAHGFYSDSGSWPFLVIQGR
jgi:hypothetical protein